MRSRKIAAVVVILVFVVLFGVPMVGASSPGPITGIRLHFTQSLDCYLLGAGPGQWIGTYYFEGGLGIGCGPLVV
jgi:hypothetical protein